MPTAPGLRTVFALPGYRRLWAARTVSQWGDIVQTVTLALLVYELTGSGFGVAAVVAAEALPVLLLAPVAGALVDRLPRVRVMVAADLVRASLVALLALTQDSLLLVFVVAVGTSVGTVFFNPAAGSLLPALVRPDALVAANSGIWSAAVLSQVLFAPLAGLLVVTGGCRRLRRQHRVVGAQRVSAVRAAGAATTGTAGAAAPAPARRRRRVLPGPRPVAGGAGDRAAARRTVGRRHAARRLRAGAAGGHGQRLRHAAVGDRRGGCAGATRAASSGPGHRADLSSSSAPS